MIQAISEVNEDECDWVALSNIVAVTLKPRKASHSHYVPRIAISEPSAAWRQRF